MNGYFRLQVSDTGTQVVLIPPTDGGAAIDPAEILQYLTIKNIPYDAKAIGAALNSMQGKEASALINLDSRLPESECCFLRISQDRMTVTARFYPPSNGGHLMDMNEVLNSLTMQKIKYGVEEEAIKAFLDKREYCKDVIVAKGKPAVQGTDAWVEYFFNTDKKAKPALNEDGSVDFKNLDLLNHVKKGDILARLHTAVYGEEGIAVHGDVIKPAPVKAKILHYGRNIDIDESKTVLTSQVDGHVTLVNEQVFVTDVYEVENVDNSTGNIDYQGNVQVNGNVATGFQVKASGNVVVNGVVEGATIEAGGDVVIARGMNGMARGVIRAGGNIVSKFIENGKAYAGGYLESESIMHSEVQAKTEVILTGKKAFVSGGHVAATNKVTCKTLGSNMGSDTVVEVGADPQLKNEMITCQKRLGENSKKLPQLTQILTALNAKLQAGQKLMPDQIQYLKTVASTVKTLQEQVKTDQTRVDELGSVLADASNATVAVSGEVYSGTKICISDSSLTVRETMVHCRFILKGGEVVMTAL